MPHTYISTAASPFRGLQKLHASCGRQALQQSGANAWMLGIHRLQPSLARGVPLCGALESRQLAHWESDTIRDDRAESQHRTVCAHKKDLHAQSSRRVPLRKSSSSGIAHIEPGHEQCRLLQDSCAECPAKAATGRAGVHVSATQPCAWEQVCRKVYLSSQGICRLLACACSLTVNRSHEDEAPKAKATGRATGFSSSAEIARLLQQA